MRLLILVLCSLLTLGQVAQAQVRPFDDIVASGALRVAVYENFPPYSFQQDGQPRGVDVELAQKLADSQGLKLELLWIAAGEKLDDDLRNFIWKGHYLRPEVLADVMLRVPYDRNYAFKRNELGELVNERVVMFAPYQRECWQVAHDTRRLKEVPSVAVFGYHPIGVELESVPSFYMSSVFGGRMSRNTRHYPSPPQAFAAMREGKVDAVMAMRGEIDWLLHEAHDPQLKAAANAYPEMGRQQWDIGMAVHESNRQLAYALEGGLEELIGSGELAAIYARYGLRYEVPELYEGEVQAQTHGE
ncbi:transporter substrate-binding domain-containing protein [Pseudomonas sp. MAP12]|uniref:Transporter substrate-binding domain-containing protein n=1 Tax=Geopseudomonas aromaticivorans TaxID=2849492 RepID=A0ABS6MVU3_9GAMM|nr:transporter substrate-binding domain-containing protein [Pseudomonas aromaticivorans]MBV2132675.1 transporter substrate-binding domain-containing protein [Pseudomonas aromaticivorans]